MFNKTALTVTIIVTVYGAAALLQPRDSFWITDGGNKCIQMRGFIKNGLDGFAVDYPAKGLDPECRFFPYSAHHFQKKNGKIFSFYPPWYPLFCLPFYLFFGWAALDLLSVLAAVASLLTGFLIIKKLGLSLNPAHLMLAGAFATPLFFYGVVFWEHALSLFLAMAGLYCLTAKKNLWASRCAAGACLGLATVFREEGYLLFAVILIAHLSIKAGVRPLAAVAAGWLAVMVPLWAVQQSVFGSFFGIHAQVFCGRGEWSALFSPHGMRDKIVGTAIFLFQAHDDLAVNLLLLLPLAGALLLGLCSQYPAARLRLLALAIGSECAAGLALLIIILMQKDCVFNTGFTQGLFTTVPFLVLPVIFFRTFLSSAAAWHRALAVSSACYIIAACLLLNASDIGVIWGPRFFLFLFPAFVPLALTAAKMVLAASVGTGWRRFFLFSLVLLFALSAGIQSAGIRTLFIKKEASSRIVSALEGCPSDVIITDIPWLAEEAAAIFHEKKIMAAVNDSDFPTLFRLLNAGGVRSTVFVFSRRFSATSRELIEKILAQSPERFELKFKHAGMLDITIAPVQRVL